MSWAGEDSVRFGSSFDDSWGVAKSIRNRVRGDDLEEGVDELVSFLFIFFLGDERSPLSEGIHSSTGVSPTPNTFF